MERRRFSWLDLTLFLISLIAIALSVLVIVRAGPVRDLFRSNDCEEQTAAKTHLSEGETWCGNGLSLTADDFCVEDCGPDISVTFLLENYSESDMIVEVLEEDFHIFVADEAAQKPGVLSVLPVEQNKKIGRLLLEPGDKEDWTWLFIYHDPQSGARLEMPEDNTRMLIDVKKAGQFIQQAKWEDEIR